MEGQNFFTRHRGWIIFLLVLPASFIYQKLQDLSNWYYRNFKNTNRLHDERVKIIQEQVRQAISKGMKLCTARAPWKTMSIRKATYKKDMAQISIPLRNVLSLDKEKMTVRVEPMATMGDVTHYLVPRGYALAVQVEMDDLTVGGLCMGIGIETSSFQYGFLFETIRSYEVVMPNGELVVASREQNSDLYHGLPMSHGTLGFLVAVELEIVQVKKYMQLNYLPCKQITTLCAKLNELTHNQEFPFVEALIYSGDSGVIITGQFVDEPPENIRVNSINRWYKPWFHTYVQRFLEKGPSVECVPLRHYYHRHTPSIFFQLRDLIPFANKGWYRWLFAWLGAPKVSLMKYSMTRQLRRRSIKNRVAQDIIIPLDKMEEALKIIDHDYGIYPLWVCPVKLFDHGGQEGLLRNPVGNGTSDHRMYVDLGIYGIPPSVQSGTWDGVKISRKLEQYTQSRGGFHMLYADIFMTRVEFEQMFNHSLYRQLRLKFGADKVFPEIYDKVIPEKWLIDLDEISEHDDSPVEAEVTS